MGHTLYIAAVTANKPTHIAFRMDATSIEVLHGPAPFEQIAEELRERFPDAEWSRELPSDLDTIEHQGTILELQEMKSWHYISFERMMRRQLAVVQ